MKSPPIANLQNVIGHFKETETMTRVITITTIILLTTFNSFGQSDSIFKKADYYKTKNFEVAIFPANYFGLISGKRFTPTKQEIDKAEIALKKYLKNINKQLINQSSTSIIHKNLKKYKRQYFGYLDINGNRILFINCFWSKEKDKNERWLTEQKMVHDGGSYYWNIKFNLQKNELFELEVNGYA
jgi:hypothetical protein